MKIRTVLIALLVIATLGTFLKDAVALEERTDRWRATCLEHEYNEAYAKWAENLPPPEIDLDGGSGTGGCSGSSCYRIEEEQRLLLNEICKCRWPEPDCLTEQQKDKLSGRLVRTESNESLNEAPDASIDAN